MKILNATQIREADRRTMEREPIASIDLMERAAQGLFEWVITNYDPRKSFAVICGTGNNGGDGLALSRLLKEHGYHVDVFVINRGNGASEDFEVNEKRLPVPLNDISEKDKIPDLGDYNVLVDAIFGTGLSRPAEGIYADVIVAMNSSGKDIISVDMPSGLFTDSDLGDARAVMASATLTFQAPKLTLLLPHNGRYAGEWHLIDIGLDAEFIEGCETPYELITGIKASEGLLPRNKFSHKGDFGRAVLMAGSYGKMGAAILAAKAALRSGIGLLTVYVPRLGYSIVQTAVPEAMAEVDSGDHYLTGVCECSNMDAVGIGPGIGQEQETIYALEESLRKFNQPMVLDADALNLLARQPHLQDLIPENSILTPHPGEFERLAGSWQNDFERLKLQTEFSRKISSIIVLKGAHTSVALPDGRVFFNITGNPGMATGGCGDVLTGILTALLASGLEPEKAALTGVYVHGLAGDLAVQYSSQSGVIAGDIINHLPEAWSLLER